MKKKKNAMTLLEIMIVIFIIGIIGSVIGYNMKGSLDKGRAFKSEQGMRQVYEILSLEVAKGASLEEVVKDPKSTIEESGLAKDPDKLLVDGWGKPYKIILDDQDEDILISSLGLEKYKSKVKKKK